MAANKCWTEGCTNVPESGRRYCRICFAQYLKENGVICAVCGNQYLPTDRQKTCPTCFGQFWGPKGRPEGFKDHLAVSTEIIGGVFSQLDADGYADLVSNLQIAALAELERKNFGQAVAFARQAELRGRFEAIATDLEKLVEDYEGPRKNELVLRVTAFRALAREGRLGEAIGKSSTLGRRLEEEVEDQRARRAADNLRQRLAKERKAETCHAALRVALGSSVSVGEPVTV